MPLNVKHVYLCRNAANQPRRSNASLSVIVDQVSDAAQAAHHHQSTPNLQNEINNCTATSQRSFVDDETDSPNNGRLNRLRQVDDVALMLELSETLLLLDLLFPIPLRTIRRVGVR